MLQRKYNRVRQQLTGWVRWVQHGQERELHFIKDVTNGRSQLFEDLWKCGLGGDSKGPEVEIRQAERRSLWLMHMMEKNAGLRISTNCKCTADILPQDFKWKSSLNMSKRGDRTTSCQLCRPPADGNSSSISGVISLQELVNLGTILQNQACGRTEAPLCAGVLQSPEQSGPKTK